MTREEEICTVLTALGLAVPNPDRTFVSEFARFLSAMESEMREIETAETIFAQNNDWIAWNVAVLHLLLLKRAAAWCVITASERYLGVTLDKSLAEERLEEAVSDFCRLL